MAKSDLRLEFRYRNKRFEDAEKGLRFFAQDLGRSFAETKPALKRALEEYLTSVAQDLGQRHSTPWRPGGSPADRLFRRSGGGIKSLMDSVRVQENGNQVVGSIAAPFPLLVHEKGATIRPKRAKYLAIPLPAALDSRGVPKKPSPRMWSNTFVAESKRGNLLIFRRVGASIEPLYALKSEVRLPPRLGMSATLERGMAHFVDRAIESMSQEFFRR